MFKNMPLCDWNAQIDFIAFMDSFICKDDIFVPSVADFWQFLANLGENGWKPYLKNQELCSHEFALLMIRIPTSNSVSYEPYLLW